MTKPPWFKGLLTKPTFSQYHLLWPPKFSILTPLRPIGFLGAQPETEKITHLSGLCSLMVMISSRGIKTLAVDFQVFALTDKRQRKKAKHVSLRISDFSHLTGLSIDALNQTL